MSRLNDLIEQAKTVNPSLGQELEAEVSRLEITEVDEEVGYAIADAYAVLFAGDALGDLAEELITDPAHENVEHVFVVTDRDTLWEQANAELRGRVAVHRLCESYLTNFEINHRL